MIWIEIKLIKTNSVKMVEIKKFAILNEMVQGEVLLMKLFTSHNKM